MSPILAPARPDLVTLAEADDWTDANQREMVRSLDALHGLLERHVGRWNGRRIERRAGDVAGAPAFALERLRAAFDLSPFERDVVLLCASVELDARFLPLVAEARGDAGLAAPSFGLALALLPDAHWSALSTDGPLRRWRLVTPSGPSITTSSLRLDERILHYLVGLNVIDERLQPCIVPPDPPGFSSPSIRAVVAEVVETIRGRDGVTHVLQLVGGDAAMRMAAATLVAEELRAPLLRLRPSDLPATAAATLETAVLCAREWHLGGAVILLDESDEGGDARIRDFVDLIPAPLLVSAREPIGSLADRGPVLHVPRLRPAERVELWRSAIGPAIDGLDGAVEASMAQFELGPRAIRIAAAGALAAGATASSERERFWDACRSAARARMGGLAQPIEAVGGWDDLVLPDSQRRILRLIASHVRRRHLVYEEWGFAGRSARGLGVSALFAGEPGTGKTMAAEVLAQELRLDLYRIDLASVVSKYIGETEKNLRALFDAAEGSGAILLFDEADALFGKRSEVRDSHDRYANVEVSYLLQRMESYRGLAILTTNMRQALDAAFLRRIRFIVGFPYPDAGQREAIWRGIFPAQTPLAPLDYARLAQLNVAGGLIRNIAVGAAFLAADEGAPVSMFHLAHAARDEYAKVERSLTDAEARGWA